MAKKTLDFSYEADFVLVAVISAARDYRLCHEINKHLSLGLQRKDVHESEIKELSNGLSFSEFCNDDSTAPGEPDRYYLISNRNTRGHFIHELRNVDYLLFIVNPSDEYETENLVKKLRAVPSVGGAYIIDLRKIKHRENLFFING